jgi:hypothetical protein
MKDIQWTFPCQGKCEIFKLKDRSSNRQEILEAVEGFYKELHRSIFLLIVSYIQYSV